MATLVARGPHPHGLPFLAIAVLLSGVGVVATLTGTTGPKRALVVWASIVFVAIAVGLTFGAIDGTMRDFDVGRTTSDIWVQVTAVVVATAGALLITRFERYGSPRPEALALADGRRSEVINAG